MTQEDMLQLRYNVLTNVTRMPRIIMDRNNNIADYDSDVIHLNDIEDIVEQLETVFHLGKTKSSIILGNEFTSEEMDQEKALDVPLYLYLDVIISILKTVMNNTPNLDYKKDTILMRLKKCREIAIKLPYHRNFHPKKHLSKNAIKVILESNGDYYFSIKKIDKKRYLSVVSILNNNNEIAYQEDYNKIKIKESEQYLNHIVAIQNHIKPYFKNNMIPESTIIFNNSLADPALNNEIKMSLFTIIELLAHEAENSTMTIEQAYTQLCKQEMIIALQQADKKAKAYAQQTLSDQNKNKTNGIFGRYTGTITSKTESENNAHLSDIYEELRKQQILDDERRRSQYLNRIKIAKRAQYMGIKL